MDHASIDGQPSRKKSGSVLKKIGVFLLVILSIPFWYVTIPLITLWYLWKKSKHSQRTKLIIGVSVIALVVSFKGWMIYLDPSLAILDPQDGISLQTKMTTIHGKVSPVTATISINKKSVPVSQDGTFSNNVDLTMGSNRIVVEANNHGMTNTEFLTITRTMTSEEQEVARREQEAKQKLVDEKKAKDEADTKAKELAWEKSKAGQVCKKHPEWDRETCEKLADGQVWIGMNIDMLEYLRGKPTSGGISNYGRGNRYQFCWFDRTPSCLYDNEGDGVIDAYN